MRKKGRENEREKERERKKEKDRERKRENDRPPFSKPESEFDDDALPLFEAKKKMKQNNIYKYKYIILYINR